MPKTIKVTEADVEYLREAYEADTPFTTMAQRLDCCVDTLKRILVRHDIAEFGAAKYVVARQSSSDSWDRKCISCGSRERRPRGLYMCTACRSNIEKIA